MKLLDLIEVLFDKEVVGELNSTIDITSIVNDTRKVKKDSCFIAIRGERFDGHSKLKEVEGKGACVAIVEELPEDYQDYSMIFVKVPSTFRAQAMLANQYYNQPSTRLNLVAVTGTNGKTTTSSMISDLLMILNHKTGLIGTMHYKVDQTFYPAVNTTPNALELQKLYAEMLESGCNDAIIEASSHALALGRLWYSDVDCAIYTNLSREHLDFHKTMEEYAFAKSLLFAQLGQRFYNGKPRLAIINKDDPYHSYMSRVTAAEILTYSIKDTDATIYATDIKSNEGKTFFKLTINNKTYETSIPMPGEYNVLNYLAAFLCLNKYYDYTPEEIINVTKEFKGVTGRMESINQGQNFQAIVDFAHTADALENVLNELKSQPHNRLIVLMGHSGGNRDSGARPGLGNVLFKYADEIVFTADNPRDEDVNKICKEMIGSHNEKPYSIIEDRKEAISAMIQMANEGDILLFAGKGGESYQIIGEDKIPYNEAETVRYLLKKQRNS